MKPKILLLAGEESGRIYADRLATHLRAAGAEIRGYGDYGFRTSDLAVMGFWPVLRKLFYFLRVARTLKRAIRAWRPDAVVTVDYPGLNLKLAAYAKSRGIAAIHIVCPQVWAWHRSRIPKVAAAVSELLCFFPFEPALFVGTGLNAKFIGHPLVGMVKDERERGVREGFHEGTDPDHEGTGPEKTDFSRKNERIVALLPGSRIGEIQRILPRLLRAVARIAGGQTLQRTGGRTGGQALKIVIPAANEGAEREIRRLLDAREGLPPVEIQRGNARALLRAADCAAVASGTATLEAALARVPTVLVYATTPTFAFFLRYFVTGVRFAGLANIISERCAYGGKDPPKRRPGEGPGKGGPMPELLQEGFTAEALAALLGGWLTDGAARAEAVAKLDAAMALIHSDGDALGNAAREILG